MAFNNIINRTSVAGILPEPIMRDIVRGVRKSSAFLSLAKKLPNMTSGTAQQPVLSMLPTADFINGDTGLKQTTELAWTKKQLVAGEIACIVPVPEAVLADVNYDIWSEARGPIVEAFGRVIDIATFSTRNPNAPAAWPDPIIPAAIAATNTVVAGTGQDIAEDISNLFGILEEAEWDVNGLAAQKSLKTRMRNLRATTGEPLYVPLTGTSPATVYGVPVSFVGKGVWNPTTALAVAADWSNIVYSIRQDMTFKIFDTGVISDDTGAIIYNLMQQDMVAMRVVMRMAWQVADPIDIDRPIGSSYPAAVLTPT